MGRRPIGKILLIVVPTPLVHAPNFRAEPSRRGMELAPSEPCKRGTNELDPAREGLRKHGTK